ncbi:hypothetical protein [Alkaliphilus serpentinus]|nr:hypothetical protein [Alkaliphilus serpentinus]
MRKNHHKEFWNPLQKNREEKNKIHQINQEGYDMTVENLKILQSTGEIR